MADPQDLRMRSVDAVSAGGTAGVEISAEMAANEHIALKRPLDQLVRSLKETQKLLESKIKSLAKVAEKAQPSRATAGSSGSASGSALNKKLQKLKKQLVEPLDRQHVGILCLQRRLAHLSQVSNHENSTSASATTASHMTAALVASRQRADRYLIDYMLREGLYESAEALAQDSGLDAFLDGDAFEDNRAVEAGLRARDCGPALAWCSKHEKRLTKLKSTLPFKLRLQQFVELVRRGDKTQALEFARSHLKGYTADHLSEVKSALGLICFSPSTNLERYKAMFVPDRWDELLQQFRRNNLALNGLGLHSQLLVAMVPGLAALKLPSCVKAESRHHTSCPCCCPHLKPIVQSLPQAHHIHSCFVCGITGKVMDENNPPILLPSGNVYSTQAIEEMLESTGSIHDPINGETYGPSDIKKLYIM